MWFWPRHSDGIPDVTKVPSPRSWAKKPYAFWQLDDTCPATHFQQQSIIFDTTFCGDASARQFSGQCKAEIEAALPSDPLGPQPSDPAKLQAWQTGKCANYIAQNPAKLSEAYWLVNQVSVFGIGGTPAPAPASPPPPTHDGGSSKIAIYFIIAASSLVVLCIGAAVWSRARDGSAGADDQLTRYGLAGACMSGCHVPRCILLYHLPCSCEHMLWRPRCLRFRGLADGLDLHHAVVLLQPVR
eukprot:COSAG01_NODE_3285_length_6309_cov_2.105153_8_plen_242_part_00